MLTPLLSVGAGLYRTSLCGIELLYRMKVLKVHTLPVPVVSIGNLTWGGTGKTPFCIHLAKGFQKMGRSPVVLTRGYGQDEVNLMTRRLHPIPVLVGPDRVALGVQAVQKLGVNLILLDDGYQQWRIKKDLEILMVDATAPFGNNHLIPRGTLREPVTAAARADLIVMTRIELCPDGLEGIEERLRRVNRTAPILLARFRPVGLFRWSRAYASSEASAQMLSFKRLQEEPICSMAGIARPEQFEATLERLGARIALKHRAADHHSYTMGEMIRLLDRCRRHGVRRIVTTAKDAVKIPEILVESVGSGLKGMELLVLEIGLEFELDESQLFHRIDSLLAR